MKTEQTGPDHRLEIESSPDTKPANAFIMNLPASTMVNLNPVRPVITKNIKKKRKKKEKRKMLVKM